MGVVPPFDKIQINAVMQKNSKIINFNPLLKRETNVYAHLHSLFVQNPSQNKAGQMEWQKSSELNGR